MSKQYEIPLYSFTELSFLHKIAQAIESGSTSVSDIRLALNMEDAANRFSRILSILRSYEFLTYWNGSPVKLTNLGKRKVVAFRALYTDSPVSMFEILAALNVPGEPILVSENNDN